MAWCSTLRGASVSWQVVIGISFPRKSKFFLGGSLSSSFLTSMVGVDCLVMFFLCWLHGRLLWGWHSRWVDSGFPSCGVLVCIKVNCHDWTLETTTWESRLFATLSPIPRLQNDASIRFNNPLKRTWISCNTNVQDYIWCLEYCSRNLKSLGYRGS